MHVNKWIRNEFLGSKHALNSLAINPLVHIYEKEKICETSQCKRALNLHDSDSPFIVAGREFFPVCWFHLIVSWLLVPGLRFSVVVCDENVRLTLWPEEYKN